MSKAGNVRTPGGCYCPHPVWNSASRAGSAFIKRVLLACTMSTGGCVGMVEIQKSWNLRKPDLGEGTWGLVESDSHPVGENVLSPGGRVRAKEL